MNAVFKAIYLYCSIDMRQIMSLNMILHYTKKTCKLAVHYMFTFREEGLMWKFVYVYAIKLI